VTDYRSKFQKVLAVAIHPGTIDNEALAAFARIRELARQNPALIHPPEPPRARAAQPPVQTTLTSTITGVHPDWLLIFISILSKTGHELDAKYRIDFDFSKVPIAVTTICVGTEAQCDTYGRNITWCVNYINNKMKKPKV
jgi:hypothetical protein